MGLKDVKSCFYGTLPIHFSDTFVVWDMYSLATMHSVIASQTDRQTDDSITSIADHTVWQHDRIGHSWRLEPTSFKANQASRADTSKMGLLMKQSKTHLTISLNFGKIKYLAYFCDRFRLTNFLRHLQQRRLMLYFSSVSSAKSIEQNIYIGMMLPCFHYKQSDQRCSV